MITIQQWTAFGLIIQDGIGWKRASEQMNIPVLELKAIIKALKLQEPALFPRETEQEFIHHKIRNLVGDGFAKIVKKYSENEIIKQF